MADLPAWVEDGFKRRADLQRRLSQAIAETLPPATEGQTPDDEHAFDLLITWSHPTGGYEAFDPEAEREKLIEMQRAAATLARLHRELHPSVRVALANAADAVDPSQMASFHTRGRFGPLSELQALPERLREARKGAEGVIASGSAPDMRADFNWRGASMVDDCRKIWRQRTGQEPPTSEPKQSTAFYGFLDAVLTTLGAGRPIPAFRAWMRAHR